MHWAYEGLLWVGGPQVDPGYVGHLFCPLYNLSGKEVELGRGEPIALMDFVTTTPFKAGHSKPYRRPPKRVALEEYNAAELRSALYSQANERITRIEKDTKERIDSIDRRFELFSGSGLVLLSILFAALAVFVTFGHETVVPVWPFLSFLFSVAALVLSLWHGRAYEGEDEDAQTRWRKDPLPVVSRDCLPVQLTELCCRATGVPRSSLDRCKPCSLRELRES